MRLIALALATAALALPSAPVSAAEPVVCEVSGTVTLGGAAAPGGLTVRFATDNGSGSGTTAGDGTFAFPTVCGQGELTIASTVPTAEVEGFTVAGPAEASPGTSWDLTLPEPVRLGVVVTDPDGTSVDGVSVRQAQDPTVRADPAEVLEGSEPFTVTMQLEDRVGSGGTVFRTFPMAQMALQVTPPAGSGLVERTVAVPATASGEVTVTLDRVGPPTAVRGRVGDAQGTGVPDVTVSVAVPGAPTASVTTDSLGGFGVDVPAGNALVRLRAGNGDRLGAGPAEHLPTNFSSGDIALPIAAGTEIDVTLPPVRTHRVTVLDATGAPVHGAVIAGADGEPFPSARHVLVPGTEAVRLETYVPGTGTSEEGVATFRLFDSGQVQGLVARAQAPDGTWLSAPVPALDGSTDGHVTVSLPPPPTSNAVHGTVRTEDGSPVQGLSVYLGGATTVTGYDGSFDLVSHGGDQDLTLWRGGGQDDPAPRVAGLPDAFVLTAPTFVPGDMTLDLVLPRAHTVGITLTDPVTGQPATGVRVGSGDTEPFRVTGVSLGGGLVASADVYVAGPPTDETGRTSFATWRHPAIDHVRLRGSSGPVDLVANVRRLEVLEDKELELVLGTDSEPATYTPPTAASDVVALPTTEPTSRTTARTPAGSASSSVRVTWQRSRRSGGLPVTGYRVSAAPGGPSVTVGPTATAAVLSGLDAGTAYSFSVRAVNDIGRAAAASGGLDLKAPKVRVTAPSDTVTTRRTVVRWKGRDDASGVASYAVRVRRGPIGDRLGDPVWLDRSTSATRLTMRTPAGQRFCVQVRATDRAGRTGAWSKARCFERR